MKKVKNPKAFNSGTCTIYTVENRSLKQKLGYFNFKEETLGYKVTTDLRAIGTEVDKVISIPFNGLVNSSRVVRIGEDYYSISLIQKKDTFPQSLKLTLSKTPLRWNDDKV